MILTPPDIDVKVQGAPDESWVSPRMSLIQNRRLPIQREADRVLEERGGKGQIPPIQIVIGTGDYYADAKDWG